MALVNFVLSVNWRPVPGAVIDGASKSSFGSAFAVRCCFGVPREDNPAIPPAFVPAATEITQGAFAYGLCVSHPGPEFPAAKTTTILRSAATFVAMLIGSSASNAPLLPQEL